MLQRLTISNYAIIEELDISFPPGFNIITGETGAGKSIIAGALNLVLGERADTSVLVNKEKKSIVEATFRSGERTKRFLQENDLDTDDYLVLRREIAVNGKSRAFINDTPVNLSQLASAGSLLVDMHRQFDTLSVGDHDFQMEVLDALAGNEQILRDYRKVFDTWKEASLKLIQLKEKKSSFEKDADYNRFQFSELDDAGFKENEIEEAEAELKLGTHAEGVKAALEKIQHLLDEGEQPFLPQLRSMTQHLHQFEELHASLPELIKRLQSSYIELQDISSEIASVSSSVNYDPKRVDELNERISVGYRLMKKHGVKTTRELLDIKMELENKQAAVLNIDEDIRQAEIHFNEQQKLAETIAANLSLKREEQIRPFEKKVNELLKVVGMPNARIKVTKEKAAMNATGIDNISFLFNANVSKDDKSVTSYQPVSKVASGGELSRLMLSIKSLLARTVDLPTMIFDEIDTGISGEAARQVGILLRELSVNRQVICITHQPQIAGRAHAHFYVYKNAEKGGIKTGIRRLDDEERVTAIAKMLAGEKPTAAALENAREMIMQ